MVCDALGSSCSDARVQQDPQLMSNVLGNHDVGLAIAVEILNHDSRRTQPRVLNLRADECAVAQADQGAEVFRGKVAHPRDVERPIAVEIRVQNFFSFVGESLIQPGLNLGDWPD